MGHLWERGGFERGLCLPVEAPAEKDTPGLCAIHHLLPQEGFGVHSFA